MSVARALGLDAGSTTVKLVAIEEAGELLWSRIEKTAPNQEGQLAAIVTDALARAQADDLPLVATGYGRKLAPESCRRVTEITCHAAGAHRAVRKSLTLIDVGGQDTKALRVSEAGKVVDFAMNDKCAAGTGRFLEVFAGRLGISLEDLSEAALSADGEAAISSTCTVFAESEIISLMAQGQSVPTVARGLFRSMVRRVAGLVRGVGVSPPVWLSGGVANSPAFVAMIGEELGEGAAALEQPQLIGAHGAALLALGE